MKRSGRADLPLHYGKIPARLYQRMASMGFAIMESIILNYGTSEFTRRLSDPFWFQSLGAALGMDWYLKNIKSFVEDPHASVIRKNQGKGTL